MTNNECKLLHDIETAGIGFTGLGRSFRKREKLTNYDRFLLNQTLKVVDFIKEHIKIHYPNE